MNEARSELREKQAIPSGRLLLFWASALDQERGS